MPHTITITKDQAGQRLDVLCSQALPRLSRSAVQKAIKGGMITLNNKIVKVSQAVRIGDVVVMAINSTPADYAPPAVPTIAILYEDRDVVVINKPARVAAHAGYDFSGPTVTAWFVTRYPEARGVGEDTGRAGIVHRLDKDTSGVMILAKTEKAYTHLLQQFERLRAKKEYSALVFGVPGGSEGRINQALSRSKRYPLRRTVLRQGSGRQANLSEQGKPAITEWELEKKFGKDFALLRLYPLTGRTHQLRAHLHWLGYPIVGDSLYTFRRQRPPKGTKRQLLHAEKLTVTLPSGDVKTFTAPLAEDFERVLGSLEHAGS